ncbi:MAG: tRNA lysidine(34) synthetase TilS [Alphaproteobacteria bacterium]|nr:tRNA lysidine(34) synthetase TilS [Alphaproteobacteria bacterium]
MKLEINQDDFENNIKKLIILPPRPKFLVAVSGGADSFCLSMMLKIFSQKINAELIAAIIDHKLRRESTEEAAFVAKLLAKEGIKSVILTRENIPIVSAVQHKAREDRYSLLKNYAKQYGFPYLFIAHHLDDQLETIMQREESGVNLVGNAGISSKVVSQEAIILRPFLNYSKAQILYTIKKFTDTWIEDPSNQNDKYTRVVNRKKIKAMSAADKQLLIDKYQMNFKNRVELEKKAIEFLVQGILINKFGLLKLNLRLFDKYEDNIKIFILRKLLKFANGKNYEVKIEKVKFFLQKLNSNDSFKYSLGNCLLKVKKETIAIYKNQNISGRIKANSSITFWDNRFVLSAFWQNKEIFIDKMSKETYFSKIKDKTFKKYFENYGFDGDFIWGLPCLFQKNMPLKNYAQWQHFNYKSAAAIFMGFFSK